MAWFVERFRDPVCARAFLLREAPRLARRPEQRRLTVKTRALFGTDDFAIHHSLAAESTALADDYRLERVGGCGHFIAEERPELVRQRVVDLFAARDLAEDAGCLSA